MTLAEKRKVIEVLLCCSDERSPDLTDSAADGAGHRSDLTKHAAAEEWRKAWTDLICDRYGTRHFEASTEAAYRLIESSPTLIREWFGGAR